MDCVNAYLIQEKIRPRVFVTIPWIQTEFNLTYWDAKAFLAMLGVKGWIDLAPIGIRYRVIRRNLYLRKLVREELDSLLEDLTADCALAIRGISKKGPFGASSKDIADAVRDEDELQETLEILTKHKLIATVNGLCFVTVSQKTCEIITEAVRWKCKLEFTEKRSGKNDDEQKIKRLFDVLFDDE